MSECTRKKNRAKCSCTYEPCGTKGVCCDCLSKHLGAGEFPACLFPADVESTFDRSIECFIKTYQQRGRWW